MLSPLYSAAAVSRSLKHRLPMVAYVSEDLLRVEAEPSRCAPTLISVGAHRGTSAPTRSEPTVP